MNDLKILSCVCLEGVVMKRDRKLISCSEMPPHVRACAPSLGLGSRRPQPSIRDGKQGWIRKRRSSREIRWWTRVGPGGRPGEKRQTSPIISQIKSPTAWFRYTNSSVELLVILSQKPETHTGLPCPHGLRSLTRWPACGENLCCLQRAGREWWDPWPRTPAASPAAGMTWGHGLHCLQSDNSSLLASTLPFPVSPLSHWYFLGQLPDSLKLCLQVCFWWDSS